MRVLRILHRFSFVVIALVVALIALPLAGAAGSPTPPPPDHLSITAPDAVLGGVAFTVTVNGLDSHDAVVTTYGGTVTLTSSDTEATLPDPLPLTHGQGMFQVTLATLGKMTITATDQSSNLTVTKTVQVDPHLVVTAPSPVVSSVPFNFTVQAVDSSGGLVTTYAGTVHFTSTDAAANVKLPSDGVLSGGEATLSATLVTPGAWTVTATDTKDALITGTSGSISVETRGWATGFSVSAPFSVTPGASFTFTVTALKNGNQVATGYNGLVAFASTDPYATLPLPTWVTNGSGTFSAILQSAGYRSITATDYTLALTGTSNSIAVGPPWAATHFSVVAPTAVTAGVPFTVTVTALDWYGHVATGYGGWVRFGSTDPLATLPANAWFYYGSASFTVTLRTVGSELVTATDTGYAGINGVSNAILVVAPPLPAPSTVGPTPTADQLFVGRLYQDLLGRPADPSGLAFWTGALASGVSRTQVAASILSSPEYRQGLVASAYSDCLNRNPDPTGLYTFVQALNSGSSDEALESAMVGSDEYYAMHGSNLYDWIVATYQDVLGRSPEPAGVAFWMGQALGGMSRTQVAAAIQGSSEYRAQLVTGLYTSLLGRSPATWEVNSWAQVLASGGCDEQVMAGIAGSLEYYLHTT